MVTLMIGSSIIARWPPFSLLGGDQDRVVNRGQDRLKTDVLPTYLTCVLDQMDGTPSHVVFYCGGNDLRRLHPSSTESVDGVGKALVHGVETMRARFPSATVLLLSVMHGPRLRALGMVPAADAVNAQLTALAANDPWIQYVDTNAVLRPHHYLDDGVHLREEGYAVLNALCFG